MSVPDIKNPGLTNFGRRTILSDVFLHVHPLINISSVQETFLLFRPHLTKCTCFFISKSNLANHV